MADLPDESVENTSEIQARILDIHSSIRLLANKALKNADLEYLIDILVEIGGSELETYDLYNQRADESFANKLIDIQIQLFKMKLLYGVPAFPLITVSKTAREMPQPPHGYIPSRIFKKISLKDGRKVYKFENIQLALTGLITDYLTRFMMSGNKEQAFEVSLSGLRKMPNELKQKIGFYSSEKELLDSITGLDDASIKAACTLCCFDGYFRAGASAYKNYDINSFCPDDITIHNIRIMVERSVEFFKLYGPITKYGFSFDSNSYTGRIYIGDGDFLTEDTLWDFKVSAYELKLEWTLQLAIYWIMSQHSSQECFRGITKIGIYNPRKNFVAIADVSDINPDYLKDIETYIVGYTPDFSLPANAPQRIEDRQRAERFKAKLIRRI